MNSLMKEIELVQKGKSTFGRNEDCVINHLHGVREALWQWEADWQQANLPQIATVTAEQAATLQETLPTCTVEKVELEASPASSRPLSIATDANEMDTSEVQTSSTSLVVMTPNVEKPPLTSEGDDRVTLKVLPRTMENFMRSMETLTRL